MPLHSQKKTFNNLWLARSFFSLRINLQSQELLCFRVCNPFQSYIIVQKMLRVFEFNSDSKISYFNTYYTTIWGKTTTVVYHVKWILRLLNKSVTPKYPTHFNNVLDYFTLQHLPPTQPLISMPPLHNNFIWSIKCRGIKYLRISYGNCKDTPDWWAHMQFLSTAILSDLE